MSARAYGVLDVAFAVLYGWLGFVAAPSRSSVFQAAIAVVALALFTTGVALAIGGDRTRVGRSLGIATTSLLLAFTIVVIVLLAISAAYLDGVYGAVGRALGGLTLAAGALIVELFGLLPLFQLRFHLRGRR